MACKTCTANKYGQRLPLDTHKWFRRTSDSCKRTVMKIYRKRNKKKTYFIGVHSKDLMNNGTMERNNGFQLAMDINYCPVCGEDLRR